MSNSKLICKPCGHVSKNQNNMIQHIKSKQHVENTDGKYDYICKPCNYSTNHESNFDKHLLTPGHNLSEKEYTEYLKNTAWKVQKREMIWKNSFMIY